MKKRYDEKGNVIYYYESIPSRIMCEQIEFKRLNPAAARAKHDEYIAKFVMDGTDVPLHERFDRHRGFKRPRHKYVQWLAYQGRLDGIFSKEIIEEAKKGFVPKDYNVHHRVPLSFGGENDMSNFVLIEQSVHRMIHTYMLDVFQSRLPEVPVGVEVPDGQKRFVILPKLPRVMTPNDVPKYLRLFSERPKQKMPKSFFIHPQVEEQTKANNPTPTKVLPLQKGRFMHAVRNFWQDLKGIHVR